MGCCDCTTYCDYINESNFAPVDFFIESSYTDSSRYRYIHFPNMDDWEISMQECLCDGEDYEEEI